MYQNCCYLLKLLLSSCNFQYFILDVLKCSCTPVNRKVTSVLQVKPSDSAVIPASGPRITSPADFIYDLEDDIIN